MNFVVTPLEAAEQTGLTVREIFDIADSNTAIVKQFGDTHRVDLVELEATLSSNDIREAA